HPRPLVVANSFGIVPRRRGCIEAQGQAINIRPVEAAGPVDAGKRPHRNLGRLLNTAGVHSSHKAAAITAPCLQRKGENPRPDRSLAKLKRTFHLSTTPIASW